MEWIKEVLERRFKRAIQEKGNFLTFPDLVLIRWWKRTIFVS